MQNLCLNYIYIFFRFYFRFLYHRPALLFFKIFLLAGAILLAIKKARRAAANESVNFYEQKRCIRQALYMC